MWLPWKKQKSIPKAASNPKAMPPSEMPVRSAEERVRAFQEEYDAQWRVAEALHARAKERDEVWTGFFPQLREMMHPIARRHLADDSSIDLAGSWSSRPEYGSSVEVYVRSEIDGRSGTQGDTTYVLFRNDGGMFGDFHEYVVREQDGAFRIVAIDVHYGDPAAPYAEEATIAERQLGCAPDAPLAELPADEAQLDQNRNFTEREVRDEEGEASRTRVEQVATLTTSSGVLSVCDFGWENDHVQRPLARTVAPGTYPIDRVTAHGRNAAVRVRFSDETPRSWRLAERTGGDGDSVGVDAGCIGIVDFAAYLSMTPRDKAAAYGLLEEDPLVVAQFSMGDGDLGFACTSGWGDGSYPVYWGLDSEERIAQLVVDFSVLVTEKDGMYQHR